MSGSFLAAPASCLPGGVGVGAAGVGSDLLSAWGVCRDQLEGQGGPSGLCSSHPRRRGDLSPREVRGQESGRHSLFCLTKPRVQQPSVHTSSSGTELEGDPGHSCSTAQPLPDTKSPPKGHTQIPAAGTKLMDRRVGQDVATDGGKDVGVEGSGCGVGSTLISHHLCLALVWPAELWSGAQAAASLSGALPSPTCQVSCASSWTLESVSCVKTSNTDSG